MKKLTDSQNYYKVLSVIIIGFTTLYVLTTIKWMLWVALIVGLLGLSSIKLLRLIITAWDGITLVLSKLIPNILLTILFYFFLTPIALLSRVFSHSDPLMMKNSRRTLFVDYNKQIKASDFEKPW